MTTLTMRSQTNILKPEIIRGVELGQNVVQVDYGAAKFFAANRKNDTLAGGGFLSIVRMPCINGLFVVSQRGISFADKNAYCFGTLCDTAHTCKLHRQTI